jgi:hypothetical protein
MLKCIPADSKGIVTEALTGLAVQATYVSIPTVLFRKIVLPADIFPERKNVLIHLP